jgi:hypothetical protein
VRTLVFLLSITIAAAFLQIACGCPCEHSKYPPVPKASDVDRDAGSPPLKACTMEAKLCPDGVTSVGRQGPSCEFAPCPGEK